MDDANPDSLAEWMIETNRMGVVAVTLVHAPSWKAYLGGRAHKLHLTMSMRQARSLASELAETATEKPTGPTL
jgi:hypothetical protein